MKFKLKDRVKLTESNKYKTGKGTVVNIFGRAKKGSQTTIVVLWDADWPDSCKKHPQPGRVFYYKEDDLTIVDTWSIS